MTASLASMLQTELPRARVSDSAPDQIAYARDLWPRHHLAVAAGRIAEHAPGAVVWPESAEDAARAVEICAREGIPLVPFGAGSGVCGGVLPDRRTVVLDLKRLSRVRSLDREQGLLEVEAGALGIRLEEELEGKGLTLGHFPSSILCSTVGGWVAARSAGQCSGRYGKIEDMAVELECVLGKGELVTLKRRLRGPDLVPLFVGSEGVLGVCTSAKLRLHEAPKHRAFGAFSFASLESGWTAMQAMFQRGLRPAVARLYDPFDSAMARMGAVRRARKKEDPHAREAHGPEAKKPDERFPGAGGLALRTVLRAPSVLNGLVDALGGRVLRGSRLVMIFEGEPEEARADLERARAISLAHGATSLGEEPARHWLSHRYSVSYRQAPVFMAGAFGDTMEVAAPWSRLGELYASVRKALGRHVFVMAHLSHAYPDGCSIYFTFAGTGSDPRAMERVYDAAWRDALDAAIAAGGTLSHHHGVGRSKAPRLGAELGHGVDVVQAMRGVFDPAGIFNPGNLLPRDARGIPSAPLEHASRASGSTARVSIDRASQVARVDARTTLAEIERAARAEGLTLAVTGHEAHEAETARAWLDRGAPGSRDPWADPVDHLLTGFEAMLASGKRLVVRDAPRRAVGPDLTSLFHGTEGRAGALEQVSLRVLPVDLADRARPMRVAFDREPALDGAERAWIDRALDAMKSV